MKDKKAVIIGLILAVSFMPEIGGIAFFVNSNTKSDLFKSALLSLSAQQSSKDSSSSDIKTSGDWVVGAVQFEIDKSSTTEPSVKELSSLLPSLILNQLGSSYIRHISDNEKTNKQIYELRTERKKLYTDLQNTFAARDSIILKAGSQKEFDTLVAVEEKKISDIGIKIDTNLAEARRLSLSMAQWQEKTASNDKEIQKSVFQKVGGFVRKVFNSNAENTTNEVYENVVIFKEETNELLKIDEKIAKEAPDGQKYEKAVIDAKIDALISGKITYMGGYVFVNVFLSLYPGSERVCEISNISSVEDIQLLVEEIADELIPYIINSNPVNLSISVDVPEDILNDDPVSKTVIRIDDSLYSSTKASVAVKPGIHTITVERKGCKTESVTWNFSGHTSFLLDFKLQKSAPVTVRFIQPVQNISLWARLTNKAADDVEPGMIYLAAIPQNTTPVRVSTEGGRTLGEYVSADGVSTFFTLPVESTVPFQNVMFTAHSADSSDYIEKSRRRMYTSYGLLLMSLPLAFCSYGRYINANNVWAIGFGDYSEKDFWRKMSYVCMGVSIGFGINMVIQLGRYLYAAKSVLPVETQSIGMEQAAQMIQNKKPENITSASAAKEDGKETVKSDNKSGDTNSEVKNESTSVESIASKS